MSEEKKPDPRVFYMDEDGPEIVERPSVASFIGWPPRRWRVLIIERCAKCGRMRPSTITDPSCRFGGNCAWEEQ